ncbi:acyltransferase [Pseudoalteromonas sp. MIP2626]|uniref:acyltransferase n=1 Tax=Pseudoalteromonas sp. MIP2626 TaxID=2705464 RepID=UPI0015C74AC7|nr:acyltransferase [Pseudoalteromonas sp. MIP2626]NYR12053.1 acyltransferase [Pseudoalteromonas sp. MIP2626]
MIKQELYLWGMCIFKYIPGRIGSFLRGKIYGIKMGNNTYIWDSVHIDAPRKLTIGVNTSINRGSILNCWGHVEIGSNVLIGPNVIIYSQNHNYKDSSSLISDQGYKREKVIIEDDVWIAANAIILPGVTLSKGTVIAAGSVVTSSTESYTVYAGVPAKLISRRA